MQARLRQRRARAAPAASRSQRTSPDSSPARPRSSCFGGGTETTGTEQGPTRRELGNEVLDAYRRRDHTASRSQKRHEDTKITKITKINQPRKLESTKFFVPYRSVTVISFLTTSP